MSGFYLFLAGVVGKGAGEGEFFVDGVGWIFRGGDGKNTYNGVKL